MGRFKTYKRLSGARMHIKLNCLLFIAFISLTNLVVSQENFQITDFKPPKTNGDAPQSSFQPSTQADIQKRPLNNVNQLRNMQNGFAPSDRQPEKQSAPKPQSYDSQPVPPSPRSQFSNPARQTRQNNQDPMKALEPGRILPPIASQGNNQEFANPEIQTIRQPATRRSLPVAPKQSIMTPRISNSINDDSRVLTSSFNNPQAPVRQQPQNQQTKQNAKSPKKIISRYDVSSNNRPLPGVPVSLEDMMRTTPVQYRKAMVQQYWETYFDWATLQNQLQHSNWLKQVANPRSRPEQMLLQTAKSMSRNDVTAAEIQLSKSQSKLQQLSRSKTGELLPLPLNQPLVTNYNSHYDWYEARNMIPAKLKGINEMLPRTHKLIADRAKTAAQAENARNVAAQAFSSGQIGLGDLLAVGSAWKTSLQGFVSTVVNYNHAISDYALTITSPQKPIEQVVAMLVAKPKSVNEVALQNSVLEQRANSRVATNQNRVQPQARLAQQSSNRINAAGSNAGPFRPIGNTNPANNNQGFVRQAPTAPTGNTFNSSATGQGNAGLPPINSGRTKPPAVNPATSNSSFLGRGTGSTPANQPPSIQPKSTGNSNSQSIQGAGNGGGGGFQPLNGN